MKARASWTSRMQFTGDCEGQSLKMDAKPPFGDSAGFTPKELVAIAAAGCTGMDVVALLKKFKQPLKTFEVLVDATAVQAQPAVFSELNLTFEFTGELDPAKVIESVQLSQTRYCAVSAMLSKALPVKYKIMLNGSEIGHGAAAF